MCGRFELIDGQRVFIRFRIPQPYSQQTIPNNADVRPTQQILAITADHQLSSMKWGLVPSWAHDPTTGSRMINARSEGIETKASFKKPLRFQRCIIPASAFFE